MSRSYEALRIRAVLRGEEPLRIAVVSDIHGNLMALDAVMTDLDSQQVDEVWCGGDVAWGGPWPSECIARVKGAGWTTVRGNTDVWIAGDPQSMDSDEKRKELISMAQAHDVSEHDAQWLLNLPLGHRGAGSSLLVHGTPESPFTAPMPDAPAAEFSAYAGQAAVVIYGHVHHAFVRRLSDGTIVANPGSVGLPKDAETASYLLMDYGGAEWILRHRRVTFDRRAGIAEARRLGGPVAQWFLSAMGAD
jgi:putative phosphoesterase